MVRLTPLLLALLSLSATADDLPLGAPWPDSDFYSRRPATISCVVDAARRQGVPANILLAIASIESGKNGQLVRNANGSYDLGHFQLNTIHWQRGGAFYRHPTITPEVVKWHGCYNAELAAWLLKQQINQGGKDYWTRAAGYHSMTPQFNAVYRKKLIALSVRWADWLKNRNQQVAVSYR